jgi:hypothetical protein
VFLYPERPENSRRKVAAEAFRTVSWGDLVATKLGLLWPLLRAGTVLCCAVLPEFLIASSALVRLPHASEPENWSTWPSPRQGSK